MTGQVQTKGPQTDGCSDRVADSRPDPVPVALVISGLSAGGSERVLSTMANHWVSHGRSTTLITLSDGSDDHYQLDARVQRVAMGVLSTSPSAIQAVARNFTRASALRQVIRSTGAPVVLSFGDRMNVLTLLATPATGLRVIVSERNDPRHHPIGPLWGRLRPLAYRRAAGLVVQTTGLTDWAAQMVGRSRVHVIENPLLDVPEGVARPASIDGHAMLAAGRLVPQKGFDILIRAFRQVSGEFPDWSLTIAGEGPERSHLAGLVAELGLSGRVVMPGVTGSLGELMSASDLFVLSSRYEGFPNVLLEAMARGLPVVSTDCPSGPADIIRPSVDGLLVASDDVDALAEGLRASIRDPDLRRRLGAGARGVVERFAVDVVMPKWDRLVDDPGTG